MASPSIRRSTLSEAESNRHRRIAARCNGAHAETIYLKCWARGLTGDQRNSVYINGEQVTVNLDERKMHSWTFGSNLAVQVTDMNLFFETAPALGNIWQYLFEPTAVWQGFINRVDGTLKAHRRDGTVISGHCEQPKRLF